MQENQIYSKTFKKYKTMTNSKHKFLVYPNLLNQEFKVDRPGKV